MWRLSTWTLCMVFAVIFLSASCSATWGYHHPVALRLPTDKPTTTSPPESTTKVPETTTAMPVDKLTFPYIPKINVQDENHSTTQTAEIVETTIHVSPAANLGETKETTTTTGKPVTEAVVIVSSSPTTLSPSSSLGTSTVRIEGTETVASTKTEASVQSSPPPFHSPTTTSSYNEVTYSAPTLPVTRSSNGANKTCVRNESEVSYWDFGNCGLNCTSDSDCSRNQNETCICDGPCGMICLRPDLTLAHCDAPGKVVNGKALLVGDLGVSDYRNQEKFVHNQKVIFECNEGFSLIDGPQEKICRNGQWFPTVGEPKCVFSDTPQFRWIQANRVKRKISRFADAESLANTSKFPGSRRGESRML